MKRFIIISVMIMLSFGTENIIPQDAKQIDDILLKAMEAELSRSKENLLMEGQIGPFFVSYRLEDCDIIDIRSNFGALTQSIRRKFSPITCQVRVGDYKLDNTKIEREESPQIDRSEIMAEQMIERCSAPLDNDIDKLRHQLWLLTDLKYKKAVSDYEKKKTKIALGEEEEEEEESPDDFSQEDPTVHLGEIARLELVQSDWETKVRGLSSLFKKYPQLTKGTVEFYAIAANQYYINSEGTKIRIGKRIYSIEVDASIRAGDGMELELGNSFIAKSINDLPSKEKLEGEIDKLADNLEKLKEAEKMKPYRGPVILGAEAAGIFMSEVLGCQLEGDPERLKKEKDFIDRVGKKIAPDFISAYDDPTLETYNVTILTGYYKFDDEGIPAQRVELVDNGVLKEFLLSRSPIKGFNRSNGHGRASYWQEVGANISNLVIELSKGVSKDDLKKALIEGCKKANEPFGLLITSIGLKGRNPIKFIPLIAYRVYADSGKEELIRGAEIVIESPIAILNEIVTTGDDAVVTHTIHHNQTVSVICPSILMANMVVRKAEKEKRTGFILPPPE